MRPSICACRLLREENYFFKLSRYGDRLLEWYPPILARSHRTSRQRSARFHTPRLHDFSVSRTSLSWGVRPVGRSHSRTVFDALANYITAVGTDRR